MLALFAANTVWYFLTVRWWECAPPTLGWWRRVRDRVKRADIIAAAQAATLASQPQMAVQMLGRYGLNLCPSCGRRPPSSGSQWCKQEKPSKFTFVTVCLACWSPALPSGWEGLAQGKPRKIRQFINRVDTHNYRVYERAIARMARAEERFYEARLKLDERVRKMFGRRSL